MQLITIYKIFNQLKTSVKKSRRRAVSPVLATVIIFGLIISGVVIVFVQVVPYVDQAKSESTIAAVQNSFLEIDSAIIQLLNEGGLPGGSREVSMNIPEGKLEISSARSPQEFHSLSIGLTDGDGSYLRKSNGSEVGNIATNIPLYYLDYVYNSPRDIVPKYSFKYMKGPNPLLKRDPVILTGLYTSSEYQDLTNLTLSKLRDNRHHLTMNYRVAVHFSLETNPNPIINLKLFIVRVSGDFQSIYNNFKDLTITCETNHADILSFTPHQETDELNIVWSFPGQVNNVLWSSSSVIGINQLNQFTLNIQQLIYEIKIST